MDTGLYLQSFEDDPLDVRNFFPRVNPLEKRTTLRLLDYRHADIVRIQAPNISGTCSALLLIAHRPGVLFAFGLATADGGVAASDTNYWVVKLERIRAGAAQVIAVKDTSDLAGEAITELVPWYVADAYVSGMDHFTTVDAYFTDNKVLTYDDVVRVTFTKVGDPDVLWAPLLHLYFGQYEPHSEKALTLLTDSFTSSVLNDGWVGVTWTVFNFQMRNAPTGGSELLTNGDFELWDSASDAQNWTEATAGATSAVARDGTTMHAGTFGAKITVDATPHAAGYYQALVHPIYAWLKHTLYAKLVTGAPKVKLSADGVTGLYTYFTPGAAYAQFTWTERASAANLNRGVVANIASTVVATDDMSSTVLDLPALFNVALYNFYNGTVYADVTAPITYVQGQGGIAVNVDDPHNPRNFVIAYYNQQDGKIYLDKCVNGEYSTVRSTTTTYVAGTQLKVVKAGTSYSVYYGGTIVGAADAITDVSIIYNPWHGLFATDPSITFDNFSAS